MKKKYYRLVQAITLATVVTLAACEQSDSLAPNASQDKGAPAVPGVKPAPPMRRAQPAAPAAGAAHAHAVAPAAADGVTLNGSTLRLTGLTLTVPDGWIAKPTPGGPMAPKAVFSLPAADGSAEPASVRITHFTKMNGMDEANIARWLGQARKPDGTAMTRSDAKIEKTENGQVRLTTVDITGTIQATMRAAPKPGTRMIAAIINHPQGPHFVTVVGDEKTISRWEKAINSFLASAQAAQPYPDRLWHEYFRRSARDAPPCLVSSYRSCEQPTGSLVRVDAIAAVTV